jgi:hypothetical protein
MTASCLVHDTPDHTWDQLTARTPHIRERPGKAPIGTFFTREGNTPEPRRDGLVSRVRRRKSSAGQRPGLPFGCGAATESRSTGRGGLSRRWRTGRAKLQPRLGRPVWAARHPRSRRPNLTGHQRRAFIVAFRLRELDLNAVVGVPSHAVGLCRRVLGRKSGFAGR